VGCGVDLWGILQVTGSVSIFCYLIVSQYLIHGCASRELSDPHRILSYLLQPSSSSLPSETISIYIQAAFKIFGHWVADLATRWNDDFLSEIKQAVDMMVGSLQNFVGSENIEVQERVRSDSVHWT
jgi:hypothetical protein